MSSFLQQFFTTCTLWNNDAALRKISKNITLIMKGCRKKEKASVGVIIFLERKLDNALLRFIIKMLFRKINRIVKSSKLVVL